MPGSIRALRRRVDPIRGGGRLPLVKRRSAGRPQFREAGSDTLSAQEEAIADAVEQAVLAVPSQTVLDSLESRDYAGYGRAVLSALTDASRAIEDALLDAFVSSGETSAIDLGRELATQYRRVGKADGPSPSEVALRFRFDKTDPRATEWARTESSRLITNMARSEQEVFRALVGQTFDEARTPGSSASLIYQQLRTVTPSPTAAQFASTLGTNLNGLTTRYERAVVNRVADRAGDLYARGITGTKALEDLQKTGDKYATKLRRARSRTIARTERMMAHNQARLLSYQQAIDTGLMSREYSRKVWATGPFDVCPICVGMAGVEAKVADPFTLPNGTQVQAPPAHPNCRCTLQTRTNTNLYEPPSLLGSNQPGDPFRFGGRGFTPEGQQFAGRPIPGTTPVAAPVDEPEIVDVAPPPSRPSTSRTAIPDIDTLRDRARLIRESTDNAGHDRALGRIAGRRARSKRLKDNPEVLRQAGLVEDARLPLPTQSSADAWLNLKLTDAGNDALDALLEAGRRARRIIDDEIAAVTDDLIRIRDEAKQKVDKIREEFDAVKLAQSQRGREQTIELWSDVADVLPEDDAQIIRGLLGAPQDEIFIGTGNNTKVDFDQALRTVLKRHRSNESLYQFYRSALDPGDARQLDFWWESHGTIADTFLDPTKAWSHLLRGARSGVTEQDKVVITELRRRHQEAQAIVQSADDDIAKARIPIIERVLTENRQSFGTADITPRFTEIRGKKAVAKKADIVAEMRDYSRRVPPEWIEDFVEDHTFGFVERGYYSLDAGRVRTSGYAQFGPGSWRSTLQHEITHGHQYYTPQINAAERLYLSRRAQTVDDALEPFKARPVRGDRQSRYELGLGDNYMTKLYDDVSELSTRASEFLWMGREADDVLDDEVLDWWLGVLLTM